MTVAWRGNARRDNARLAFRISYDTPLGAKHDAYTAYRTTAEPKRTSPIASLILLVACRRAMQRHSQTGHRRRRPGPHRRVQLPRRHCTRSLEGRDPLDGAPGLGAVLLHTQTAPRGLLAGAPVHLTLSLAWTGVFGACCRRRAEPLQQER